MGSRSLSLVARAERPSVPTFSLFFSARYRQSFPRTPIPPPRLWMRSVVSMPLAVWCEREAQPAGLSRAQSLRGAGCKGVPLVSPPWALSTNERPRRGRHRPQGRFRSRSRWMICKAEKCSNATLMPPNNATHGLPVGRGHGQVGSILGLWLIFPLRRNEFGHFVDLQLSLLSAISNQSPSSARQQGNSER
jgi:hypothetical protein